MTMIGGGEEKTRYVGESGNERQNRRIVKKNTMGGGSPALGLLSLGKGEKFWKGKTMMKKKTMEVIYLGKKKGPGRLASVNTELGGRGGNVDLIKRDKGDKGENPGG